MKPLRRERESDVMHDPLTGHEDILPLTQKDVIISDEGSVNSDKLNYGYSQRCGCTTRETGGRCHECRALVCVNCFGRCEQCRVPLCPEHSRFLETEGQEKTRLCRRCHEEFTRKRRLSRIGRFFLSIFVEVGGNG